MGRKNKNRQRRERKTPPAEEYIDGPGGARPISLPNSEMPAALVRCKHDIVPAMACTWCFPNLRREKKTKNKKLGGFHFHSTPQPSSRGASLPGRSYGGYTKNPEVCRDISKELFGAIYVGITTTKEKDT